MAPPNAEPLGARLLPALPLTAMASSTAAAVAFTAEFCYTATNQQHS